MLAFAVVLLTAVTAAAPAPDPTPIALAPDELDQLARRKIVVRPEVGEEGASGGAATGVMDVVAAPARTLDAILDLAARVGEVTGLRAVEPYDVPPPAAFGARWELALLGTSSVFHVRYHVDRGRGVVTYGLDGDRTPNDLVALDGSYHVYAVDGGSRVVYRARTESGRAVPRWVAGWIASQSLKQQLEGIRARAEAP